MTFEQKNKAYTLSRYLIDGVISCCPEGFLLNPHTFCVLDNSVFSVLLKNPIGCFHFPVNPKEVFSWITENSDIILSGEYLLKGWKKEDCYFLAPVLIKQSCEIQLPILKDLFREAV